VVQALGKGEMILVEVLAVLLITLHGSTGQEIDINPEEVVTLRTPRDGEHHLPPNTRCVINMTDGKFNAVREDCRTVLHLIEEKK
jgi:hypothetical protein